MYLSNRVKGEHRVTFFKACSEAYELIEQSKKISHELELRKEIITLGIKRGQRKIILISPDKAMLLSKETTSDKVQVSIVSVIEPGNTE